MASNKELETKIEELTAENEALKAIKSDAKPVAEKIEVLPAEKRVFTVKVDDEGKKVTKSIKALPELIWSGKKYLVKDLLENKDVLKEMVLANSTYLEDVNLVYVKKGGEDA